MAGGGGCPGGAPAAPRAEGGMYTKANAMGSAIARIREMRDIGPRPTPEIDRPWELYTIAVWTGRTAARSEGRQRDLEHAIGGLRGSHESRPLSEARVHDNRFPTVSEAPPFGNRRLGSLPSSWPELGLFQDGQFETRPNRQIEAFDRALLQNLEVG